MGYLFVIESSKTRIMILLILILGHRAEENRIILNGWGFWGPLMRLHAGKQSILILVVHNARLDVTRRFSINTREFTSQKRVKITKRLFKRGTEIVLCVLVMSYKYLCMTMMLQGYELRQALPCRSAVGLVDLLTPTSHLSHQASLVQLHNNHRRRLISSLSSHV